MWKNPLILLYMQYVLLLGIVAIFNPIELKISLSYFGLVGYYITWASSYGNEYTAMYLANKIWDNRNCWKLNR